MVLLLIAIKMVLIGQNYGLQIRAFLASAKPEKMYLYSFINVINHINDHSVARVVMSSSSGTIFIPQKSPRKKNAFDTFAAGWPDRLNSYSKCMKSPLTD